MHWARHLLRVRALQARTGGFTEFVPLPFVPMATPIYLKGRARSGPTLREAILMHAVARLALHPLITNIQTSWVKMGPEGVKLCLDAGANDLGGTLMDESITRAAGAVHGQELPPGSAGGVDPQHRPRAAAAHGALRQSAGRADRRVVRRAAAAGANLCRGRWRGSGSASAVMDNGRDIVAVVPVKGIDAAKSRLAPGYPPEFRRGLAQAMLEDVLVALCAATGLAGVVVVTVDPLARELAERYGARIFDDGARDGHTGAVMAAARRLAAEGRTGMLTLPGDIPLITADEVSRLLDCPWRSAGVQHRALARSPRLQCDIDDATGRRSARLRRRQLPAASGGRAPPRHRTGDRADAGNRSRHRQRNRPGAVHASAVIHADVGVYRSTGIDRAAAFPYGNERAIFAVRAT